MSWQNRIVATGEVDPASLAPNPKNARRHPKRQRRALLSALDAVGVIQDVIVNRRSGLILDGHLRVELAKADGQATIPVKYVDLDEREEALALAAFDPVGALAYLDLDAMTHLRDSVAPALAAPLAELLDELAPAPVRPPRGESSGSDRDDEDDDRAPADPDNDPALGYTLVIPNRAIPMTAAEFKDLTDLFFAYLEDRGMMFGFVRWLTA